MRSGEESSLSDEEQMKNSLQWTTFLNTPESKRISQQQLDTLQSEIPIGYNIIRTYVRIQQLSDHKGLHSTDNDGYVSEHADHRGCGCWCCVMNVPLVLQVISIYVCLYG